MCLVIDGCVSISDVGLERRDSLGVCGGDPIIVTTGAEDAGVLFVESSP